MYELCMSIVNASLVKILNKQNLVERRGFIREL